VRVALGSLPADATGTVVVVPSDAPLLRVETLAELLSVHSSAGAAATVLTSIVDAPDGYGRVVRAPDGSVARIVEDKDATDGERQITEVAAAVYAFDAALLRDAVGRLSTDNAQGEEYLP
jgi:bifunctional UDP-N-acetylglucosamine pyrophosphorylase/glucosamine-1-phosphate N-acetyltransferase